jgi:ribosomal protein L11 methyltransferase
VSTWAYVTDLDLEAVNVHLPALEDAGLLGIVEETPVDGDGTASPDAARATLHFPVRVEGLPIDGTWREIPETDWHADYRASIQPIEVGPLTIVPPWLGEPGPGTLVIEMGQAFGNGHHETTTGCLAALLELDLAGKRVLDVGTGTGLLAIAAAHLGATEVVGCDTDPLSIEAAEENADRNGVDLALHLGSIDAVPQGTFDVVVANIDTATLGRLAGDIVARIARRGALVASGVSIERREEAVAAFEAAGLAVMDRPGREWVVLTAVRA